MRAEKLLKEVLGEGSYMEFIQAHQITIASKLVRKSLLHDTGVRLCAGYRQRSDYRRTLPRAEGRQPSSSRCGGLEKTHARRRGEEILGDREPFLQRRTLGKIIVCKASVQKEIRRELKCDNCDFPYAWWGDRWYSPEERDRHNGQEAIG